MHIVDLSYYYSDYVEDPERLLQQHRSNIEYANYLPSDCNVSFIKFMAFQGHLTKSKAHYYFFRGSKSKYWLLVSIHRFIRQLNPDVVLLHSFLYPLQVLLLRKQLGSKIKLIIQHHAERPGGRLKALFQKWTDRYIDFYLFTAKELASPWQERGIIENPYKVLEVVEGSTHFEKVDKAKAQRITGVDGHENFLWVGRLDANKDPLSVVSAFLKFARTHPGAKLYMIYQHADLESAVRTLLHAETNGNPPVILIGEKAHDALVYWYSSVDYFISGSHSEGSGYALIEAMACGCIPVVTNIPSFQKITRQGTFGFLYEPGNVDSLYQVLNGLENVSRIDYSNAVVEHFKTQLSFKSIADNLYAACRYAAGV